MSEETPEAEATPGIAPSSNEPGVAPAVAAPAADNGMFMGLNMTEAELDAIAKSYFNRFDTDGSKSINSAAELDQLVTNLTFQLKIPKFCTPKGKDLITDAISSKGDLEKDPVGRDDFVQWFKDKFLGDNEGAPAAARPGADGDKLKIACFTWNVGNAMPVHDLTPFVAPGGGDIDILAFGAQECEYSQSVPSDWCPVASGGKFLSDKGNVSSWHHWFGVIQTHLGDAYVPVDSVELMQMRLIVFAKASLEAQITNVESASEATGLMHIVGNKGGLIVRFTCRDTSFCFVSCHLAAHEGEKHREARNDNCMEVLEGARVNIPQLDVVPQTHHVFWMGDLNYRVDPYRFGMENIPEQKEGKLPKSGTPEHKDVWDKIQTLIQEEKWEELWKYDELREELASKHVLCGFEEGEYNFAPTFKVLTEKKMKEKFPEEDHQANPLKYTPQRWPAYCDRVLWHSHPSRLGDVNQTVLTNLPQVVTSDHKPVKAEFNVTLRPKPSALPSIQPAGAPDIWLSNLKGHGKIKAMDATGLSDPYILFFCPEIGINLDGERIQKTTVQEQTLSPVWEDSDIPVLPCMTADKERLRDAHLMVCMQDYDALNADDDMGWGTINLAPYVDEGGDFDISLSCNGTQAGWVKGNIKFVWPGEGGTRETREFKKQGCMCCSVQ